MDQNNFTPYGFPRSTTIPTQDQINYQNQDAIHLKRRLERWKTIISHPTHSLPQTNDMVKRFIRKGIPRALRARCWFAYSGAEDVYTRFPNMYQTLLSSQPTHPELQKSIEVLKRDLPRTFPNHAFFTSDLYLGSLERILTAFAVYSLPVPLPYPASTFPRCKYSIGYCQSLNYVAGLLLIVFVYNHKSFAPKAGGKVVHLDNWEDYQEARLEDIPEEEKIHLEARVFHTLCALVEMLPMGMYGDNPGLWGARIEQNVLYNDILGKDAGRHNLEAFGDWYRWNVLGKGTGVLEGGMMPPLDAITLAWMTSLFTSGDNATSLPPETTLRVWDVVLTEGYSALLRVILTIFLLFQDQCISSPSVSQQWQRADDGYTLTSWSSLKQMLGQREMWDSHGFMHLVFSSPRKLFGEVGTVNDYPLRYSKRGVGPVDTQKLAKYRSQYSK